MTKYDQQPAIHVALQGCNAGGIPIDIVYHPEEKVTLCKNFIPCDSCGQESQTIVILLLFREL